MKKFKKYDHEENIYFAIFNLIITVVYIVKDLDFKGLHLFKNMQLDPLKEMQISRTALPGPDFNRLLLKGKRKLERKTGN